MSGSIRVLLWSATLGFGCSLGLAATWSEVAPLNTDAAADDAVDGAVNMVAGDNGTILATWHWRPDIATPPDLRLSRSTDGGLTWDAPYQLTSRNADDSTADHHSHT